MKIGFKQNSLNKMWPLETIKEILLKQNDKWITDIIIQFIGKHVQNYKAKKLVEEYDSCFKKIHGPYFSWTKKHQKKILEANYNDGLLHGLYKSYLDGILDYECYYINDKMHGKCTYYWQNGNIKYWKNMNMGLLDGEWKEFGNNNNILIQKYYENNVLNGIYKEYYHNGSIETISNYTNGKLDGCHVEFNVCGKEKLRVNYVLGIKHGEYFELSSDHYTIGKYNNGNIIECNDYYLNGKLKTQHIEYNKYYIEYFDSGNKHVEKTSQGEIIYFDSPGKIQSKKTKNSHIEYFESGNLCKKTIRTNLTEEITIYYDKSDSIQEKYSLINGFRMHGPYIKYHLNGNIDIKCNYNTGVLDGEYLVYYPSGNVRLSRYFVNGQAQGEQLELLECGEIKRRLCYLYDVLHGPFLTYKDGIKIEGLYQYGKQIF